MQPGIAARMDAGNNRMSSERSTVKPALVRQMLHFAPNRPISSYSIVHHEKRNYIYSSSLDKSVSYLTLNFDDCCRTFTVQPRNFKPQGSSLVQPRSLKTLFKLLGSTLPPFRPDYTARFEPVTDTTRTVAAQT